MTTKADVLELITDRALELLAHARDPESSMRGAARAFIHAGFGVVGLDTGDAGAFVEGLIEDNALLCLKLRTRPVDASELTSAETFEDLVAAIVERCASAAVAQA